MITPPARVAFKISSILNLPPCLRAEIRKTIIQEADNAKSVLIKVLS
jgi:hypothetical protein